MIISEKIQQNIQKLPASLQVEVLNYVEYLLAKTEKENSRREIREWSGYSLSSAMREMEGEEIPLYSEADIKVKF